MIVRCLSCHIVYLKFLHTFSIEERSGLQTGQSWTFSFLSYAFAKICDFDCVDTAFCINADITEVKLPSLILQVMDKVLSLLILLKV